MAISSAQKIIERAEAGERVSAKERRHAIAYLLITAVKTNYELSELFFVTERMIRADKKIIKVEKKEIIKDEDVGLVVVDLQMNIERQIRDLERSKAKTKEGTDLFVKHCLAVSKIQLDLNKALQDLGWLPKNIGNMTISNYDYKAVVHKDGSVISRRVDAMDEIIEAQPMLPAYGEEDGTKNEGGRDGSEPARNGVITRQDDIEAGDTGTASGPSETVRIN